MKHVSMFVRQYHLAAHSMVPRRLVGGWLFLVLFSLGAQAETYQCRNAQGVISFQDAPCDGRLSNAPASDAGLPKPPPIASSASQSKDISTAVPEFWFKNQPSQPASAAEDVPETSTTQPTATPPVPPANPAVPVSGGSSLKTHGSGRLSRFATAVWHALPVPFAFLAVLGWVIPWLRTVTRSALDGRNRIPMFGALYRGYWWRAACAGLALALTLITQNTELFFWLLALLALFPIWHSVKLGRKVNFALFGEFDWYERQQFPELYENSKSGEYEIPDDAVARVLPLFIGSLAVTGLCYWSIGGLHSYSLFGGIVSWLSALLAIFSGLLSVIYLALLAFLLKRDRV